MGHDTRVNAALESSASLRPFLDDTAKSTLWIGFSGGVDSTVLLYGLRHVRQAVAVHIDHGLVAEAPSWVLHCSAVAVEIGVPFVHRSVKVAAAGSREGAARTARHEVWRSLVEAGDVLVLGHHADDQAETRVWQLLTGREPGGMPSERPLGCRAPGSAVVGHPPSRDPGLRRATRPQMDRGSVQRRPHHRPQPNPPQGDAASRSTPSYRRGTPCRAPAFAGGTLGTSAGGRCRRAKRRSVAAGRWTPGGGERGCRDPASERCGPGPQSAGAHRPGCRSMALRGCLAPCSRARSANARKNAARWAGS